MVWIEFYLDLHNCPKTMGVFEFELIIYLREGTLPLKPLRGQKKSTFFSFFFNDSWGDNTEEKLIKKVFQGMLNIFCLKKNSSGRGV